MAIDTLFRNDYTGNNSTADYDFTFKVYAATDLKLIVTDEDGNETELTLNADYSVAFDSAFPSTGSITLLQGGWLDDDGFLDGDYILSIERAPAFEQTTVFGNQAQLQRAVIEAAVDRAVMLARRAYSLASRAARLQEGLNIGNYNLVLPKPEANKVIGWNNAGTDLENKPATAVSFTGDDSDINHLQSGSGAVARSVRAKLRQIVMVTDFGTVGDGVTDDTAAITSAIAAAAGKTLVFPQGVYLITSKITLGAKICLRFEGGLGTTLVDLPGAYLLKKSTMTTAAVEVTAGGVVWEGGGIVGQVGNTGDGLVILSNGFRGMQVFVGRMGGVGFRGGSNTGTNANSGRLTACTAHTNGSHGFYLYDSSNNCNVWKVDNCVASTNAGDGFRNGNGTGSTGAQNNHFTNCVGESNTGYGIYLASGALGKIDGGDYEANVAGQIVLASAHQRPTLVNINPAFTVTDDRQSVGSSRLDEYEAVKNDWIPVLTGTATTTKAVSEITRSGTTLTLKIVGHTFAVDDTFALLFCGSGAGPTNQYGFDGGYRVASVVDVDHITATLTSDQASKLPTTATTTGASIAVVGYAAAAAGSWMLINGWVFLEGRITASAGTINALISGFGIIRGLPLIKRTLADSGGALTVICHGNVDLPANTIAVVGTIVSNDSRIILEAAHDNAASDGIAVGAGGVKNNAIISISGFYRAY